MSENDDQALESYGKQIADLLLAPLNFPRIRAALEPLVGRPFGPIELLPKAQEEIADAWLREQFGGVPENIGTKRVTVTNDDDACTVKIDMRIIDDVDFILVDSHLMMKGEGQE